MPTPAPKLIACLLIITAAAVFAADTPVPRSSPAVRAMQRHAQAMKAADQAWQRAAVEAARTLIRELEEAKAQAMKGSQLEEANAIQAAIDTAKADLDALQGKVQPQTFSIDAAKDWQPTIEVKKGQKVEIRATGQWCGDTKNREVWTVGPDGRKHPRTGEQVCYLEGRIGGRQMPIGSRASFVAEDDGVLELRLQDPGGRADNDGSIHVTVR